MNVSFRLTLNAYDKTSISETQLSYYISPKHVLYYQNQKGLDYRFEW